MQIENNYKIEKATEKDGLPQYKYVLASDNLCIATNGIIAAVVPCVIGENDIEGPIVADAIEYARKHTHEKQTTVLYLKDDTRAVTQDGSVFPRSVESKADQKQLTLLPANSEDIPQKRVDEIIPIPDATAVVMRINPSMLRDLAEAMGDKESITLSFHIDKEKQVTDAIRADNREKGSYGVIMPR